MEADVITRADLAVLMYWKIASIRFAQNVPAFENVANLDQLPVRGATVIALPMKIRGGSGGPLRIIALLPP